MGGSDDVEVKDSEAEKALAQIAKEKWELYNEMFVPLENQWMEEIGTLNSEAAYDRAAGTANASIQGSYGQAMQDAMAQGGSESDISRNINNLALGMQTARTDSTNAAQINQQNRYVEGLQAINAVGQGAQAEALTGLSDSAAMSQQYAEQNAYDDYASQQSTNELIGAGIGGATRWGIG